MKLIIDISEKDFYRICQEYISYSDSLEGRALSAISVGTPLPKRHGRLIDADALKIDIRSNYGYEEYEKSEFCSELDDAPTIVEADKTRSEEWIKYAPTVYNIKNAEWLEYNNQTRFYVKCSNCKTLHDEKSNYCPFCGTRMNGNYKGLTKIVIGENDVI